MATGSLIKIYEEIVTSAVASVTLTGIDSTYDVYQVVGSNIRPTTARQLEARVTKSGVADSTANYDWAYKGMYTGGTFVNESGNNTDSFFIYNSYEETTASGRGNGLVMYLFNFNNASEYSFMTLEQTYLHSSGALGGNQGGCVHTVASASDGVQFLWDAGVNFEEATFTLYGLKK